MRKAFRYNSIYNLTKSAKFSLTFLLLTFGLAYSLHSQKSLNYSEEELSGHSTEYISNSITRALDLKGSLPASKFPIYDREISLHVDNDAMLLLEEFDKYYSSGIYLSYRKLLSPDTRFFKLFNKNDNLSKSILSYTFEHRFFTPRNIKDNVASKIDRPYAGWIDMAVGLNYHFKKQSVLSLKYDLGLLGPGTQSEELQIWFHGVFGMKEPRGWKYQINNTLATNISMMYQKEIFINKLNNFDVVSESSFQVGTIRSNVRTGLAFRLGMFGDLAHSIFTQSNMGQERIKVGDIPKKDRLQELYFFYRIKAEYVIHNATIDGNIVGTPSEFTKSSLPWVRHQEFGIGRGGRLFDMLVSFHHRTRENKEAKNHQYVTIALTQRF